MPKPIAIVVTLDCGCPGGNNRADIPRLGITFFNDDPAEAAARAVRFAILHAEQTADEAVHATSQPPG